ncbi:MAG TPA: hypothetical protein DIT04_00530 [Dysgonomonas sp.]|nr:hypothetical protein [Dysgonomonas sp.]
MDTHELSKRYMEEYDKLVKSYEDMKMNDVVTNLNDAISRSDMSETEKLHNTVLEWNTKVSKLEGARIVLDAQFSYLRLPSPSSFGIIFDWEERVWRFNTVAI